MRVVYDTNVLLSAMLYGGRPLEALAHSRLGKVTAVTSPSLINEYAEILSRKFHVPSHDAHALTAEYEQWCDIVIPVHTITVLQDEPDNRVLEAAVEGACKYIVTGDKALLTLTTYKGVHIVTVDEFLAWVGS